MSQRLALWLSIVVVVGCAHRSPSDSAAASTSPVATGAIRWSPSLRLQSIALVDRRFNERFEAPYEVARFEEPTATRMLSTCADYFLLQPKGFAPTTDVDAAALKVDGAHCHALRALRTAKAPSRVAPLVLTASSLDDLPARLAPAPSPVDIEEQAIAAKGGKSWKAYDKTASLVVIDGAHARVTSAASITQLEILAQADFDEDGSQDSMVLTTSGGTEGTWKEVALTLISRETDKGVFQVLRTIPL